MPFYVQITLKEKNFPSCPGGTLLATEPIAFDAKKSQMVS